MLRRRKVLRDRVNRGLKRARKQTADTGVHRPYHCKRRKTETTTEELGNIVDRLVDGKGDGMTSAVLICMPLPHLTTETDADVLVPMNTAFDNLQSAPRPNFISTLPSVHTIATLGDASNFPRPTGLPSTNIPGRTPGASSSAVDYASQQSMESAEQLFSSSAPATELDIWSGSKAPVMYLSAAIESEVSHPYQDVGLEYDVRSLHPDMVFGSKAPAMYSQQALQSHALAMYE